MVYVVLGSHFTANIFNIFIMNTNSIKDKVRCMQTLTVQDYKSKRLHLKRRGSPCIFQVVVFLSIRSFRTYFPPEFLVVFNRFQCKKYQIFDEKF
jgi:hypothetical protein